METTDNTLIEMQQQMQLLKKKLDSQEIVKDKMLWNAALDNVNNLKNFSDVSMTYLGGFVQITLFIVIYLCGYSSIYFVIYNILFWTYSIIGIIRRNKHLPDLQNNLLTAASELVKYKQHYIRMGKIIIPLAIIWLLWAFWDFCTFTMGKMAIPVFLILSIITVGITIPLALNKRREVIEKIDDLIRQINELQA